MTDWTARELVELRLCSPPCLLARDASSACSCPCGGEYHGALATAPVSDAECPHVRLARSCPHGQATAFSASPHDRCWASARAAIGLAPGAKAPDIPALEAALADAPGCICTVEWCPDCQYARWCGSRGSWSRQACDCYAPGGPLAES